MRDFVFYNPTRIIFGRGQIESLAAQVPKDARVLLIAGGGSIKHNGVYEQVKTALDARLVSEFWGIEPNPDIATLLPALKLVEDERVDFLLAVGSGSVVDAAKFLAGIARTPGEPLALLAKGGRFTGALPLGVVLTLPGTGTESNSTGALSNRAAKTKTIFSSPLCFPQFAVLDPETTFSLPARYTGNGVVDAFVHVLEQYLTFPVGAALQDRLAESVLQTLVEYGPRALTSPDDYEVRANVMWSATLALNGLIGLGVPQDWTTHHIGHELTALFGIDHARSLAAVLPSVLETRQSQKRDKLLQYGSRVFGVSQGSDEQRAGEAIARTRAFFESMGVPTGLRSYELTTDDIPKIIANLKAARRLRMGERLDVTLDDVGRILNNAL